MNEEKDLIPDATESAKEGSEENAFADTPESDEGAQTNNKTTAQKCAVPFLFDVLEMFAWSVFVVLIVFSFAIRLCRVDGQSMEDTLHDEEKLLIYSWNYTPEQDDIIVFHLTQPEDDLEKTLVKRVIATEGQTVEIDFNTGKILIDGVEYDDQHKVLKRPISGEELNRYTLYAEHHYDADTKIFSATVPEGHVFVMGDNRNYSLDGRSSSVGFVDTRCILGKAILRLSPFTTFS